MVLSIRGEEGENVNGSYRLELEKETSGALPPSEPNDTVTAALEMSEEPSEWIGWPGDRDVATQQSKARNSVD